VATLLKTDERFVSRQDPETRLYSRVSQRPACHCRLGCAARPHLGQAPEASGTNASILRASRCVTRSDFPRRSVTPRGMQSAGSDRTPTSPGNQGVGQFASRACRALTVGELGTLPGSG
jgi:hypothetical protein